MTFTLNSDIDYIKPMVFSTTYLSGSEGEFSIIGRLPLSHPDMAYVYGFVVDSLSSTIFDADRAQYKDRILSFSTSDGRTVNLRRK